MLINKRMEKDLRGPEVRRQFRGFQSLANFFSLVLELSDVEVSGFVLFCFVFNALFKIGTRVLKNNPKSCS